MVEPDLTVPGFDGVFALGDAAAVPDLEKGAEAICPPTAQHAMRQGWAAAKNVAAALHGQKLTPYRHKDLGLVVDLGGIQAVSKPMGVQLTGLPAQFVARAYHLGALRTVTARFRTAANWGLNAVMRRRLRAHGVPVGAARDPEGLREDGCVSDAGRSARDGDGARQGQFDIGSDPARDPLGTEVTQGPAGPTGVRGRPVGGPAWFRDW